MRTLRPRLFNPLSQAIVAGKLGAVRTHNSILNSAEADKAAKELIKLWIIRTLSTSRMSTICSNASINSLNTVMTIIATSRGQRRYIVIIWVIVMDSSVHKLLIFLSKSSVENSSISRWLFMLLNLLENIFDFLFFCRKDGLHERVDGLGLDDRVWHALRRCIFEGWTLCCVVGASHGHLIHHSNFPWVQMQRRAYQLLAYFLLSRSSVCLEASPRDLVLMIIMIKYLTCCLSFISSGGCPTCSLGPIGATKLFVVSCTQFSQLLYDRCGCCEVVCTGHHGLITFWWTYTHLGCGWRRRAWRRLLTAR